MERLAETHGFRWADRRKRFLGIHRGIVVEVSEWDGKVTFVFSSPTAHIGDQVLEDFSGFAHLAEAGIPTNWVRGLIQRDANGHEHTSDNGCRLSIDTNQIDDVGVDAFARIPDLVADDFHAHGAVRTLPCANCDQKEATTVGLLNYAFTPMCRDCWQDIQFRAWGGKLATEQSVNWRLVLPALVGLTAVGGLIWGFLQQPERLDRFGLFSLLLPAVWAFGLCWAISRFSGGVTRTLRLSLFVSVVVSVLAGNIWGYRSFVVQQTEEQTNQTVVGPDCVESIKLYFTALPNSWPGEAPFLLAGLVGAWIGLRRLKGEETIDVQ